MDFDFTTETITPDDTDILTIGGTGALELPIGTTANRPSTGVSSGAIRWNTDLSSMEVFSGSSWSTITTGGVTSVAVSGGTTGLTTSGGPITTSGTITLTGTLAVANGGTGQTTIQTAINSLAGGVTTGSYLRGNGTNVVMSDIQISDVPLLNQNTTGSATTLTIGRTIAITGDLTYTSPAFDGSQNITAAGTLATVNAGIGQFAVATFNGKGLATDATSLDATGDVTGTSSGATIALTIADSAVTLAKQANISANSLIGNATASAATPAALTGTQATVLLDNFTSTLKGLAPASGGGTTNILRADGTWVTPTGRTFTFGGTGIPAVGTDRTPWLRASQSHTSVSASLTSKVAPSGGSFVASILRSTDGGATFPTTVVTLTLTVGNQITTSATTVVVSASDILRLDIASVNGASDWIVQLLTL